MTARNIEEAIVALDSIASDRAAHQDSRALFSGLYAQVTRRILDGITNGLFEDGPRMNRFDTIFANRYLDAYAAYDTGRPVARSWKLAFDACRNPQLLILQHLLLGMNAHINLDLALAAAQVAPGPQIEALRTDFFAVSGILAAMLDATQAVIDSFSPIFGHIDAIVGDADERLGVFSMDSARAGAWRSAVVFANIAEPLHDTSVHTLDRSTRVLGRLIIWPGPAAFAIPTIRALEARDIQAIVAALRAI